MSETIEHDVMTVDNSTLATLNKSEIDIQIATAKQYPRSIKDFRDETLAMVTLDEEIAESCIYSLPRGGKTIEGASARFAEIVVSAWGNSRAGARVVSESEKFITAQGAFYDLQRNVAITYEVQRRITDKRGARYKDDMISVTANAACSIALRNAILKGIPKSFWGAMFDAARKTVMGDYQTLGNRRAAAFKALQAYGLLPDQVLELLGVKGEEDITLEHLVTLRGTLTSLKEGETTPEILLSKNEVTTKQPAQTTKQKLKARKERPLNVDKTTGEILDPVPPSRKKKYSFNQILGKIDEAQNDIAVDEIMDLAREMDLTETLRDELKNYGLRRKRALP
jgi:hypothetical protein